MVYSLVSIYFDSLQLGMQYKETVLNLRLLIQELKNFDLLEKGPWIVSPSHFVYDFQEKCFSCYTVETDQISLPGCLYFLR